MSAQSALIRRGGITAIIVHSYQKPQTKAA
jgi:hypothetical protein